MTTPNWSIRSMGLSGYKKQVERRLAEYGYEGEPPSDRQYLAAWQAQTCAKRLAAAHKRRQRKGALLL